MVLQVWQIGPTSPIVARSLSQGTSIIWRQPRNRCVGHCFNVGTIQNVVRILRFVIHVYIQSIMEYCS